MSKFISLENLQQYHDGAVKTKQTRNINVYESHSGTTLADATYSFDGTTYYQCEVIAMDYDNSIGYNLLPGQNCQKALVYANPFLPPTAGDTADLFPLTAKSSQVILYGATAGAAYDYRVANGVRPIEDLVNDIRHTLLPAKADLTALSAYVKTSDMNTQLAKKANASSLSSYATKTELSSELSQKVDATTFNEVKLSLLSSIDALCSEQDVVSASESSTTLGFESTALAGSAPTVRSRPSDSSTWGSCSWVRLVKDGDVVVFIPSDRTKKSTIAYVNARPMVDGVTVATILATDPGTANGGRGFVGVRIDTSVSPYMTQLVFQNGTASVGGKYYVIPSALLAYSENLADRAVEDVSAVRVINSWEKIFRWEEIEVGELIRLADLKVGTTGSFKILLVGSLDDLTSLRWHEVIIDCSLLYELDASNTSSPVSAKGRVTLRSSRHYGVPLLASIGIHTDSGGNAFLQIEGGENQALSGIYISWQGAYGTPKDEYTRGEAFSSDDAVVELTSQACALTDIDLSPVYAVTRDDDIDDIINS